MQSHCLRLGAIVLLLTTCSLAACKARSKPVATAEPSAAPEYELPPWEPPPGARLTTEEKERLSGFQTRFQTALLANPRTLKKMEALDHGQPRDQLIAEQREWSSNLLPRGLVRLEDDDLNRLIELRWRLGKASRDVCAELWTGPDDPANAARAFVKLTAADMELYTDIATRAGILELEAGEDPLPAGDKPSVGKALRQIAQTLPSEQGERFLALVRDTRRANEDPCFITLNLYGGLLQLEEPIRLAAFRTLLLAELDQLTSPDFR